MDIARLRIQSVEDAPTQNWWRLHAELVALPPSARAELVAGLRRIGGALYIEQNIAEHSLRTLFRIIRTRRAKKRDKTLVPAIDDDWGDAVPRGCFRLIRRMVKPPDAIAAHWGWPTMSFATQQAPTHSSIEKKHFEGALRADGYQSKGRRPTIFAVALQHH